MDVRGKEKVKNPTGKGKEQEKMVQSHQRQANVQKIQGQCWNCGEAGRQSKDCWARPQKRQSQGQSNSPGKGNDVKGKSGKGGGKRGKSEDAGALANWKSSCELGGVVCTADGNKHNGWYD